MNTDVLNNCIDKEISYPLLQEAYNNNIILTHIKLMADTHMQLDSKACGFVTQEQFCAECK